MSSSFKAVLAGALLLGLAGPVGATLDEVAQALAVGDHTSAIALLQALPATERDSYRGRLLSAETLVAQEKREEAAGLYRGLIEEVPAQPEAYNNLAVLYAAEGRTEEALELLERAMKTSASYATVRANLGQLYLDMSLNSYAKALRVDEQDKPPSLQALYRLNRFNPSVPDAMVLAQTEAAHASSSAAEKPRQTEQTVSPAEVSSGQENDSPGQPSATGLLADAELVLPPPMESADLASSAPEAGSVDVAAITPEVESAEVAVIAPEVESAEVAVIAPEAESAEVAVDPPEVESAEVAVIAPEVVSDETLISAQEIHASEAAGVTELVVVEDEPVSEPAAPNIAPASDAIAVSGPEQAVLNTVQAWAKAWQGQDVEAYLGAYAEGFVPSQGLSREQWQAQRRQRLSKPELIEVELEDIAVTLSANGSARVSFLQRYRSDRYRDKTRKRLYLVKEGEGWKILAEKTLEVVQ